MKKIGIEDLLTWAFTQELPKIGARSEASMSAAPSSWNVMSDMIALGTMIDKGPNCYGVVSGFVYEGEPHQDAIVVGDAVRALADVEGFEIGAGWKPFPEWQDEHGLIAAEVARVVEHELGRSGLLNGRYVVNLVTNATILKRGPCWHAEEPRVAMIRNSGKDAWFIQRSAKTSLGKLYYYEDDGFNHRSQRPFKGAYRKWRLVDPLRSAIIGRMEWQLWQSALEMLFENLSGRLLQHELVPFTPNRFPWRTMVRDSAH